MSDVDGAMVSGTEIATLIDRIREHRFDGYDNIRLADEVDRFRAGRGTGGIIAAVDALKAVGEALADTERTLREELAKLGVEWQSEAGERAGAAVNREAGFSAVAKERVDHAAEMLFAQAAAFSRTLHKLPEAQTLRDGAGGYDLADTALSLIGYETDNARKVRAGREARQQALAALNAYAAESAQHLAGSEPIAPPEALRMTEGPRLPEVVNAGGGPVPTDRPAGTTAASAPAQPAASTTPPPPPLPGRAPVADAPTPAFGVPVRPATSPARHSGSEPGSRATTPSSAPRSTGPSGAPGSGAVPPSGGGATATPGGAATPGPAAPGTGGPGAVAPGPGAGAAPVGGAGIGTGARAGGEAAGRVGGGEPGGRAGGGTGAPPAAGGLVGKVGAPGGGGEPALGKGRSFGSAPQAPAVGPGSGSVFTPPAPKTGGNLGADIGAGVTALGAGGVAGALSGEGERRGRGVGRSAPLAARSPQQLPVGDLPEEEARLARNSEKLNPKRDGGQGGVLERAAPRDDDPDGGHVRKYGVDDADLFTDQREVAPDVIGEGRPDGHR
ncbi:PPE-repeat protein [Amycolatopsis arida]|uniref:PPE-repeat protein n=1 Tax=Amycolatopsis arida TaxID=587909 RepID=A0A1I5T2L0_9PSEU|nr:hypothetical protein [Amycolatopsis arida]TDX96253.1 PPE-repeat protein [Amycolatopsis arida]SFP77269.1 PPE-repeat protein [Amycolatopsis arida]